MKVEHIITRFIIGGAQENTLSTVLGLREIPGVNVTLVTGPTTGPEGSLEPVARKIPGLLELEPCLTRPVSPARDILCLISLVRRFRRTRPDIVHTHIGKAGILGRLAAKLTGVPHIVHGIHGPTFGNFQGALANLVFTNVERLAGRCTEHFIVVANAMRDQYLAAGIGTPEQYTRVFSGFKLEPYLQSENDLQLRAKLGLRPDDIVVGKIARLFPLKGHDKLFDAAPEIIRRNPRIKFLLVGDGILREKFQRQVAEMGIADHFIFAGLVPPEQIASMTGIIDILVHLSYREGLPRVLPQALASGKPVIAFDCDGAKEVCVTGKTGILVPLGDTRKLQEAICQLAAAPELRQQLGQNGRNYVAERFTEAEMVRKTYQIYTRLMGRNTKN